MKKQITLKNVKVHNLKGIDLTLNHNEFIVFTGVSGSGKSSLAFDTIYVEGQRRYIESLSTYARRYLGNLTKPEADQIEGISPTIAIEQKSVSKNPRSTVGTLTGIYDFLRVLFAKIGIPHCPVSGSKVFPQSAKQIIESIAKLPSKTKVIVLAPYITAKKGELKDEFADLQRKGFMRIRLDGNMIDLEDEILIDKKVSHDIDLVVDRFIISKKEKTRIAEAVEQGLELGKGIIKVLDTDTKEEELYSQFAYSRESGISYPPLQPHDFSFNHPSGMCPDCEGLGIIQDFNLDLIIDPNLSIAEGCCSVASSYQTVKYGNIYFNLAELYNFSVDTPWNKLIDKAKKIFLHGTRKKWTKMYFVHPVKGTSWTDYIQWKGVLYEAKKRFSDAKSESYRTKMKLLMGEVLCSSCQGSKIKPYPAHTTFKGKRIHEITAMPIEEVDQFFQKVQLTSSEKVIATDLLIEIQKRLTFLKNVGLYYLTIDRTAPTLSGGEGQRVRLASQIGSGLVGTTYILDEPSIGLHPRDQSKLIVTLKALRDKGNSIIVVEHDEETILSADTVVDVGPLAGSEGGEITFIGPPSKLLKDPKSITGAYLSHKKTIPIPKKRRKGSGKSITIKSATHHNLQNLNVKIPLGKFVAVTGVSGSGKSSLISDILFPKLSNELHHGQREVGKHDEILGIKEIDKVIAIDQTPIGRTPRSNPSTYIKLFDHIRDLFAKLPISQASGFKPGRFSFNVEEGSCTNCKGIGMTKLDMDFMEDLWVLCPHCQGRRFDQKTLSVHYKGKTIYDVLQMTVQDALLFFESIPHIYKKLELLSRVGLDYITLGKSSTTLSGGEAQRIKLSKELSRSSTGKTLYILDEPTTGLHFHDIRKLIEILQELTDQGNTVLVIEHNMDLVKTTDWVIDLGPEGGKGGGKLMAEGTPEQMSKHKSATALALQSKTVAETKATKPAKPISTIDIIDAAQNNLKGVTLKIPRGKITICTGPSGSGKTSLAFETIYAEGQRRYIESLSIYARQFVKQMPKPKLQSIEGLSPAIAIEQKKHAGNPRSTVGTMTEIYDYLRLIYTHLGTAYCPETGEKIESISKSYVASHLMKNPEGTRLQILSPLTITKQEPFETLLEKISAQGFLRIRLNGEYYELDDEIPYSKGMKNELFLVIDRIAIKKGIESRLLEAIEQATILTTEPFVVALPDEDLLFNPSFAVKKTGKTYPAITPHTFSFNSEEGMCPDCAGLGYQWGSNLTQHDKIMKLTPYNLMRKFWKEETTSESEDLFLEFLESEKIDPDLPLYKLPVKHLNLLLNGSERTFKEHGLTFKWKGLSATLAETAKGSLSFIKETVTPLLKQTTCHSCNGKKLNPLARNVMLNHMSISDLSALSITNILHFLHTLEIESEKKKLFEDPINLLLNKLQFLHDIGLDYLSLDRSAPTLSGGETQRIHLAKQLGSGLTGCLYILDEPTIGLHPHNNERLNQALKELCNKGNTLILVEHDPQTLAIANHIIDFGPGAGTEGGQITASGTYEQIKKNKNSLTGAYLSGKKKIPLSTYRREGIGTIEIKNANLHNLKNISVTIPTGVITCITGVSGSGKSTLMHQVIKPAATKVLATKAPDELVTGLKEFTKLIHLDQNPIGHTIRSDVSTYSELLTPLRSFYASLPEAKIKGLQPRHFSYHHRRGVCRTCWGLGFKRIYLQFLPAVKVTCDACQGQRLNPLSLKILYKGKNFGELLTLTVDEAKDWLPPIPKIVKIIETLISVGLGYLTLGQSIASLSGGEAGRLRLTRELSKRKMGKTLYLFDEPSIGLHSSDIEKLVTIFHTLVNKGNTVIIIEHQLDIIANADHIIDLGPEGGLQGGQIVAQGTPEQIISTKASHTANYLKGLLKKTIPAS